MNTPGVRTVILAALAAGLLAGLVVGAFHSFATEPVIDQAIALEELRHAGEPEEEPIVTREVQKTGLVVGYLLYGAFLGLVFGAVYALVRPRFGGAGPGWNGLLAALAAWWLIGLLPFLKYPANPPGVGDPETIGYRQALLLLFWVLSVGGVLVAGWTWHLARPRLSRPAAMLAAGTVYAVYTAALFLIMPANPDPVPLPPDLVLTFRALSVAGLTLFWLVLGAVFGGLLHRGQARALGSADAPPRQPAEAAPPTRG